MAVKGTCSHCFFLFKKDKPQLHVHDLIYAGSAAGASPEKPSFPLCSHKWRRRRSRGPSPYLNPQIGSFQMLI